MESGRTSPQDPWRLNVLREKERRSMVDGAMLGSAPGRKWHYVSRWAYIMEVKM